MSKKSFHVVMDTMVLVKGISGTTPQHTRAYQMLKEVCDKLVVTHAILVEYKKYIGSWRRSLDKLMQMDNELHGLGKLIDPRRRGEQQPIESPRIAHESDQKFIDAAVACGAAFLVTENVKHFEPLAGELQDRHGVSIVSSAEYVAQARRRLE